MYVRSTPTLLDLLIAWRGSILPYIAGRAVVVAIVSVVAVLVAHRLPGLCGVG